MAPTQSISDSLPRTRLEQTIVIEQMITMFYFEFGTNYVFPGEYHNFWEILYVDRGELEVRADDVVHNLKQGMMIFHKPNEYHRFHATRGKAPNLIVLTFECHSPAMLRFSDKVFSLEREEYNLLAEIIKEGRNAFQFPFDCPLVRRPGAALGSEQLIKCFLEAFLIRLLRKEAAPAADTALTLANRDNASADLVEKIIVYMEERISEEVSLQELSRTFHVSRTQLQQLFKKNTGRSVMEYMAKARVDRAKIMIREGTDNMTEIASKLGFSSSHYFSKAFKKATRMSPTEYARTVMLKMEQ